MSEHKYGYNYFDDLKQLYGEDYEEIDNKRYELFSKLENETYEIKLLRNIIQNPVPTVREELIEWVNLREKIIKQYNIKKETIKVLKQIECFVNHYHVKEN